eukprot:5007106-Pyramimonas_sp.AAC.1
MEDPRRAGAEDTGRRQTSHHPATSAPAHFAHPPAPPKAPDPNSKRQRATRQRFMKASDGMQLSSDGQRQQ